MWLCRILISYHSAWLIDKREFEKAKIYGEQLLNSDAKMIDGQRTELLNRLLLLELIGKCNKEEIARLNTDEVKKNSENDTTYALAKLFHKDNKAATEILEAFNEVYADYPFPNLLEGVREMMELVDRLVEEKLVVD